MQRIILLNIYKGLAAGKASFFISFLRSLDAQETIKDDTQYHYIFSECSFGYG